MIKAIIFDMDGVLIEAKEWHYEALNRALGLFGYEISRAAHLTTYDGLPTKKKLELLSLEEGLPMQLHGVINELKQQYTMEMVHTTCRPRFNHEFALSRLKAEGYKLAVASNSISDTISVMLQKAHLYNYFDVILSNQDVTHSKPHPEIYQEAIRRLNLTPEQCLVVEDNEHGIQAAKSAQAAVLVVKEVSDVTYDNIKKYIEEIERRSRAA